MSVMFKHTAGGRGVKAVLEERRFCLQLCCSECGRDYSMELAMMDEPNDTATKVDLIDSGVLDRICCAGTASPIKNS